MHVSITSEYSAEQKELFRRLIDEERCTSLDIVILTGIPKGSIEGLCKKVGTKRKPMPADRSGNLVRIHRARNLALLRIRYGEPLAKHFPH